MFLEAFLLAFNYTRPYMLYICHSYSIVKHIWIPKPYMCAQTFSSDQVHLNKQGALKFLGFQKHTKQAFQVYKIEGLVMVKNLSMLLWSITTKFSMWVWTYKHQHQSTEYMSEGMVRIREARKFTFITRNGFPTVFQSSCPILHVHVNLSIQELALKSVPDPRNEPSS
jgi:hypothetical protein